MGKADSRSGSALVIHREDAHETPLSEWHCRGRGAGLCLGAGAQARTRRSWPSSSTARPTSGRSPKPASRRRRASCRTTICSSNIPSRRRPPSSSALMDDLVAAGVAAHHGQRGRSQDLDRGLEPRSARRCRCFTTDSDAPKSKRIAYIGCSNTDAGKQAGEIDAEGAAERRQVHRLRRPARRRQRPRAHRGREGSRSRARRSS